MEIHDPSKGALQQAGTGQSVEMDQYKLNRYLDEVRDNQNLTMGSLFGLAAALIGAAVWAGVAVLTNHHYGIVAIGIGFLVGYAVRMFGKGIDTSFGVVGAAIALLGCAAGNFLSVVAFVSQQEGIPFFDLLAGVTPTVMVSVMKDTFRAMDLLFYGLAAYMGYKYSFRPVTPAEMEKLKK